MLFRSQPQVFISSADWLPRNFFRRLELAFPIEDGVLRERVINEVLGVSLSDNAKARFLRPDGSYWRPALSPPQKPRRSQFEFIALAGRPGFAEPVVAEPRDGKIKPIKVSVRRTPV